MFKANLVAFLRTPVSCVGHWPRPWCLSRRVTTSALQTRIHPSASDCSRLTGVHLSVCETRRACFFLRRARLRAASTQYGLRLSVACAGLPHRHQSFHFSCKGGAKWIPVSRYSKARSTAFIHDIMWACWAFSSTVSIGYCDIKVRTA